MASASKRAAGGRDFVAIATRWAQAVLTGKVVACSYVKAACRRHIEDLKRSKAGKGFAYVFDPWHGADICDFAEKMPHVKGSWDPPTIVLAPPQIFILVVLFGWRRVSDGKRRFSMAYIEMARKGAKSTIAAVIGLYCLCCEGEVGPEIYVGATTGAQAFDEGAACVLPLGGGGGVGACWLQCAAAWRMP